MSISGGIKFFSKSRCLVDDGATVEVDSGEVVSDFMIDKNPITYWNSVASSDTVTENLVIRFNEAEFNRILLLDHNFKEYNIQYWNGSSYSDFTNVVGLDGALVGGISETNFSKNSSYYEFTAVETTQIRIQATKTQVANDEKYLSQAIACTELGTLSGYPKIGKMKHSRSTVTVPTLSGKSKIIKGYQSFSCQLKFDNYPKSYDDDLDLMLSLFDMQDPFLVWLCGGRYGSTYFGYTLRGFRLQDVYQCNVKGDIPVEYYKNLYQGPIDLTVDLEEHV